MDKVYIRLLSMSLLLSLYGAGVAVSVSLSSTVRDVLTAINEEEQITTSTNANRFADRRTNFPKPIGKVRSALGSLSNKLAEVCCRAGLQPDLLTQAGSANSGVTKASRSNKTIKAERGQKNKRYHTSALVTGAENALIAQSIRRLKAEVTSSLRHSIWKSTIETRAGPTVVNHLGMA